MSAAILGSRNAKVSRACIETMDFVTDRLLSSGQRARRERIVEELAKLIHEADKYDIDFELVHYDAMRKFAGVA